MEKNFEKPDIKDILGTEGPIFGFLDKAGQLIGLSVVWILGCMPLVTVASSTTALYYAVIKSIRRDYGSAMQEFWQSYRRNLKRGIPITMVMALTAALLGWNIWLLSQEGQQNNFLLWGSIVLLAAEACTAVYICPVLSRFSMSAGKAVRLAFVMSVRFFPITLILGLGTVLLVYLQIFVLPIPTVLLLPSLWAFASTFLMEKALRKFMPPKEDNDDSWYYQ